ncbi:MAG: DNA polymerase III subunit gamma/tau [Flavobacteriaceae bacterium]
MEQFIVSARKYRPQIFEDVVGQKAITATLENAIQNNHLAQALLFTGPRGVGKTTCARILAKRINQEKLNTLNPDEDFAFNIFELDAASNNSVDDIRNLTEQVRIPPQTGHYKVYIIDEVHMLSQSAFNAFLKTLEEPPAHAIFILATTEKHKIIPTILSRCQIFDFKRIGVLDIKEYLKKITTAQGIEADDAALHIIAQKADGALRDALSIFDRIVSFTGNKITRQSVLENLNVLDYEVYFNITDLILKQDIPKLLMALDAILSKGFEGHNFIIGLASHFRDLLVAKDAVTISLLEVDDKAKESYSNQAKACSTIFLTRAIDLANSCDLNFKTSKNQRLLIELTLMQLASIDYDAQKKKSKPSLIPAATFKDTSEKKAAINIPKSTQTAEPKEAYKKAEVVEKILETAKKLSEEEKPVKQPVEKPTLNIKSRRPSALSLKSLNQKEKIKEKDVSKESNENLPQDIFTSETFLKTWHSYLAYLERTGEKLMLSILKAEKPKVNGSSIELVFPNKVMEASFNKGKSNLIKYLRQELNNFKIDIKVIVNESVTKEYIYTSQEKYQALKKKNPNLELLKKTFKLDL